MNIIYLSSSCSDQKFDQLTKNGLTRKLPQAQKYHHLLREGLAAGIDGKVTAISVIPVNRRWTKKVYFACEQETVNGIDYIYEAFININILRQWTRYRAIVKRIKKLYQEDSDTVLICDVLNQSAANAARKCGKKYGIPVIGIVTDVPGNNCGARARELPFLQRQIAAFASKRAKNNLSKYDAYLLLTEAMNSIVNLNNKPYVVIEGHSDSKMGTVDNNIENKHPQKTIMYAGGIHKEFGIARMVQAFLKGDFQDWELHIYGDGNYQKELEQVSKQHPNVKYFGVVPNQQIVGEQLKATLLVNPRLTDAEYVKYSFPSKTMECMASGTPLLTTKLPGMPKEYYDYVYFIEDETEEGMLKAFQNVLSVPQQELHEFGDKAKAFVLEEKSNIKQANKLIEFIQSIRREG